MAVPTRGIHGREAEVVHAVIAGDDPTRPETRSSDGGGRTPILPSTELVCRAARTLKTAEAACAA